MIRKDRTASPSRNFGRCLAWRLRRKYDVKKCAYIQPFL